MALTMLKCSIEPLLDPAYASVLCGKLLRTGFPILGTWFRSGSVDRLLYWANGDHDLECPLMFNIRNSSLQPLSLLP